VSHGHGRILGVLDRNDDNNNNNNNNNNRIIEHISSNSFVRIG
jgi:hypothetical protein